jgi:hypothetical protein
MPDKVLITISSEIELSVEDVGVAQAYQLVYREIRKTIGPGAPNEFSVDAMVAHSDELLYGHVSGGLPYSAVNEAEASVIPI